MLKLLLFTCLLAGSVLPTAAQQVHEQDIQGLLLQLKKEPEDTARVNLLLQVSGYYFLKDARDKANLDNALQYARSAENLSNALSWQKGLGNSYAQLSKVLHFAGDSTKGKNAAYKAIEIFRTNNYQLELGYAWYDLSGYYSFAGTGLAERIRMVEQSLAAFQQAHSKLKEADIYKELGDLHQIQGNFLRSLQDLKEALKLYQGIGYQRLMGVYDLLGFVSTALGDQKEGIRYGLLAVKTAEMLGDTTKQICTIYNRLGITYVNLNEPDKASIYFQKALAIAKKYDDHNAIHELALNSANLLLRQNKPSEALTFLKSIAKTYPAEDMVSRIRTTAGLVTIYGILGQYQTAQQYCDQLLSIREKNELNDEENGLVYGAVIPIFLANHNYPDAHKYLAENTTLAAKTGSLMNLSANHLWWFRLDSAQGDYLTAISHYQQYKKLNDSLFSEAKSRQIHQLEILYNIEKKDQDLELKERNIQLLTKQAQLQHSELQQTTLTKNVTLGGIALLLVMIILLYKNSQHRLKSNRLLQEQQAEIQKKNNSLQNLVKEKDWLVKEIHHRVKNNFHMVIGLLGTQSGYLKSEEAAEAIGDSQHRIHAMSLIHQKLYQSDNLSAINMPGYIHELVDYLGNSFNVRKLIRFRLQIDRIELDLSHCIPIGLILNEAITNSIKYAFPDNREGLISITFTHAGENKLLLQIADNGAGLPAAFDREGRSSMGMNLMQGLSEDIDGKFSIDTHCGTEIRILFCYDREHVTDITITNNQQAHTV